jgi:hypothetical protein
MQGNRRHPSSALRSSQATAAELVAGGSQISIPAKQPLGELKQGAVREYAESASPAEIDAEEFALIDWAVCNHRLFEKVEIVKFETQAGPKGGGSEHDAWVVLGPEGKIVIRRTINDSYGFRFSSPFRYLRRLAEFSEQVPAAPVSFLGVSKNPRGNGVIWTAQPYIEGTHPTQSELVAELRKLGWQPAGTQHNHLVFKHVYSGVQMHDVHAGNFIRQKNGALIPIDVFFEGL